MYILVIFFLISCAIGTADLTRHGDPNEIMSNAISKLPSSMLREIYFQKIHQSPTVETLLQLIKTDHGMTVRIMADPDLKSFLPHIILLLASEEYDPLNLILLNRILKFPNLVDWNSIGDSQSGKLLSAAQLERIIPNLSGNELQDKQEVKYFLKEWGANRIIQFVLDHESELLNVPVRENADLIFSKTLLWTFFKGNADLAERILKSQEIMKRLPNAVFKLGMTFALKNEHLDVVEKFGIYAFSRLQDQDLSELFTTACQENRVTSVNYLLNTEPFSSRISDVHVRNGFMKSITYGSLDVTFYFLQTQEIRNQLSDSTIRRGIDEAARTDALSLVKYALETPEIRTVLTTDSLGNMIRLASQFGAFRVVHLMLREPIVDAIPDVGLSDAFFFAARSGHFEMIQAFIEYDKIHHRIWDQHYEKVLEASTFNGYDDIVRFMIHDSEIMNHIDPIAYYDNILTAIDKNQLSVAVMLISQTDHLKALPREYLRELYYLRLPKSQSSLRSAIRKSIQAVDPFYRRLLWPLGRIR